MTLLSGEGPFKPGGKLRIIYYPEQKKIALDVSKAVKNTKLSK